MLRRHFLGATLTLTEGSRLLEQYHNSGQDPEEASKPFNALEHIVFIKAFFVRHYHGSEFLLAMDTAYDAVKKGWVNIGVWGDELITVRSLVGVNPKTDLVERLPPLPVDAERVKWTNAPKAT